jgi:tRNA pseudouridine55 synthase
MHNFDFPEGELLLIDKPYDWTSFDVVNKVRCLLKNHLKLKKIKVGHAGTLDPLATGLLIVCTGKFTKRIDEFQALNKEYTGSFIIGATTPSSDLETLIDKTFDYSHVSQEMIYQAAKTLTGFVQQEPPLFSAKKIEGVRAYEMARKGSGQRMETKEVEIKEFTITKIQLPSIEFRVQCSKGTYIRSLARDFGNILGCGAYLNSLCRTKIGNFHLENAFKINDFEFMLNQ